MDNISHNIGRSLKYIYNNIYTDLNVEDIADNFGYTREHFSRQFKKEIGTSVAKYIESLRMVEAEKLLTSTDMKQYEISDKLCYANGSHFISVFSRCHNGVTPKEYRKKQGTNLHK